jgi:hypothetical protein
MNKRRVGQVHAAVEPHGLLPVSVAFDRRRRVG